mgnify:CR=1 FL=1
MYVRKLNATASKGAAAGALANALNHNFGITIHNYAIVNFDIFIKVVDILGGVDVPLYYSEYIYMNAHTTGEDHIADEVRYMCMARPIKPTYKKQLASIGDDPLDLYRCSKH